MMERVFGLSLEEPGMLLLALLPVAALLPRVRRRAGSLLFAPAALPGASSLPGTFRTRLALLPRILMLAGLLGVVLALARPAERVPLPERSLGIDILLCLDVSSSMSANDMDRSRTRLEVARDAASRFIRGRPGDRIGLLVFARFSDLRCPPTLDHEALLRILGEVAPVAGDGPEDATGIGAAAARAAQVLGEGDSRSRVAILLTDGEENVGVSGAKGEIAPAHAAQLCERLGVRVYAVVAGGGGADTAPIERLAERSGGAFLPARDAASVGAVYGRIDRLERSAFLEAGETVEERFLPFLAAGVALLLLGRLLEGALLGPLP